MNTLVLHIGTPKTGTTSLQKSLYLNKKLLLVNNILYPESSTINASKGHHNFLYEHSPGLRNKFNLEKGGIAEIANEFNEENVRNLIISAEGLKGLPSENIRLMLSNSIRAFKLRRIIVLIYIRRSDLYLHSGFIQNCKLAENSLEAADDYISSKLHLAKYDKLFLNWNSALKSLNIENKLIVRPYSKEFLIENCVIRDFLASLASEGVVTEIMAKEKTFKDINANNKPYLSHLAVRLHLKAILNEKGKSMTVKIATKSAKILDDLGWVDPFKSYTLFNHIQAVRVYESSLISTKRLCGWLNNTELSKCLLTKPTTKEFPGLPDDFDLYSEKYIVLANDIADAIDLEVP